MEAMRKNPAKRDGLGLALTWALVPGLVLLPALPGRGQAPNWEKIALPDGAIYPNPAWDEPDKIHPTQRAYLAADRAGRMYFSNGPKLHIGSGTHWRTVTHSQRLSPHSQQRPLAAGSQGTVLWGKGCSRDGGMTWDTLAVQQETFAYGVFEDGAGLLGQSYDVIKRSEGCSDAWTYVHHGRTYGSIRQFAVARSAAFALPDSDRMLVSLSSGQTWKEWEFRNHHLTGETVRAMRFQNPPLGTPLFVALNKPDGKPNTLLRLHVFYTGLDTLKGALPDSAITSLWFDPEGGLWVGTRGQGIHVSRGKDLAFTAVNTGLGSLYVEALESASDGTLYAATRDGLYRARDGVSGIRSMQPALPDLPPLSRSRARLYLPGLPAPLQGGPPKARLSVLADGRFLIMPAGDLPHPIR